MEDLLPLRLKVQGQTQNFNIFINSIQDITFQYIIKSLNCHFPNNEINAFDYNDEDGDLITVRSDDEVLAMMSFHCYILVKNLENKPPLVIYPKIKKNNFEDFNHLKIETKNLEMRELNEVEGSKKKSGNLGEILSRDQVNKQDVLLLDMIGSGNYATVYKGKHVTKETNLAVKVIPVDLSEETKKQIISEMDILRQCKSPVIISFLGAYFHDNMIYICTEFMNGGSLDEYKKVPEVVLGEVSSSVVQGLQYLWSLKILHRDVKPSNMLVNTDGLIKLCDFGISVQLIDSIAKTYIGTNAYMAPERIQGQDYSIPSEVWSLGVSLFELASSSFPFKTNNICLLKSIVLEDPPILSLEKFSPQFVDFVSKCMQKLPENRPRPEDLMDHPFIRHSLEPQPHLVSEWIIKQLSQKKFVEKNLLN